TPSCAKARPDSSTLAPVASPPISISLRFKPFVIWFEYSNPRDKSPAGASQLAGRARSGDDLQLIPAVPRHPFLDHRRDPLAPFAAVEDAVMADVFGEEIALARFGEARGQRQCRAGLADARDVVALALDGKQGGVRDRGEIHCPAAMGEFALGQRMALKDVFDGLQIEFGGHVADR